MGKAFCGGIMLSAFPAEWLAGLLEGSLATIPVCSEEGAVITSYSTPAGGCKGEKVMEPSGSTHL